MALYAIQTRFIGCKNPSDKFITIAHCMGKCRAEARARKERMLHPQDEFRVVYVREKV